MCRQGFVFDCMLWAVRFTQAVAECQGTIVDTFAWVLLRSKVCRMHPVVYQWLRKTDPSVGCLSKGERAVSSVDHQLVCIPFFHQSILEVSGVSILGFVHDWWYLLTIQLFIMTINREPTSDLGDCVNYRSHAVGELHGGDSLAFKG